MLERSFLKIVYFRINLNVQNVRCAKRLRTQMEQKDSYYE